MERFDFVVCRDCGFGVEAYYGTRETADLRFNQLTAQKSVETCAFYSAETGGLVNSYCRR